MFLLLEGFATALLALGWVKIPTPMRTMLPLGTEDWRAGHITADTYRESDPVLLWRPVAHRPYTSQRFKGPLIEPEKPADTLRIFCYGDSNTDGPDEGGWPQRLQEMLQELLKDEASPTIARVEVINAGVAGYSSHQGLLRFRSEVARYRPDLVLVSFGWNDAARVPGPPDKLYQAPPPWLTGIERWFLKWRFYRLARAGLRPSPPPETAPLNSRVSLDDYLANLESFLTTAREHGAIAVLLTRPHRESVQELSIRSDWRADVPSNNQALRNLEGSKGAIVIDVARQMGRDADSFVDECHFTPEGHRTAARFILNRLVEEKLTALSPPVPLAASIK